MKNSLRIGIAGLGTVGAGVLRLLEKNADQIEKKAGRPIEIVAVSARDKTKDRGMSLSAWAWEDNPLNLARRPDIDLVVELVGGEEGVAKELAFSALQEGKDLVTANKALLARYGEELADLCDAHGSYLFYEAAVAGGIPAIKSIKEGLAGNELNSVSGILNGTCNYILTEMERTGQDFKPVLKEAQRKGYAEADPGFDIDGIDAAHKICLLSSIVFGAKPKFNSFSIEGIKNITIDDIRNAETLGYRIKLLARASKKEGQLIHNVGPCMIRETHSLAGVNGVLNAVYVAGDFVSSYLAVGPGAGAGPTASAVVSDLIDCALGNGRPVFGVRRDQLWTPVFYPAHDVVKRFYIRLPVIDKVGVLSDITHILKDHNISIETFIQTGRDPGQPVSLMMTTHHVRTGSVKDAAKDIEKLEATQGVPCLLPIEEFDEIE